MPEVVTSSVTVLALVPPLPSGGSVGATLIGTFFVSDIILSSLLVGSKSTLLVKGLDIRP